MSARRIVSHVQTVTSGGERLGVGSARFRRQLYVTVSRRARYSQCVYNWGSGREEPLQAAAKEATGMMSRVYRMYQVSKYATPFD